MPTDPTPPATTAPPVDAAAAPEAPAAPPAADPAATAEDAVGPAGTTGLAHDGAGYGYTQEYLDRGSDRIGLHVYPEPEQLADTAIVIWPAMGTPARYYRPFANDLRDAGLAVVVADLRGTGTSTPPPSRQSSYGYAELVADVEAVQEALAGRFAGRRRLLLGHSLGGQVSLIHAALAEQAGKSSAVDGVVLVAAGVPYYKAYPTLTRSMILPYSQTIGVATAVLGVWPGWGFGGRQARGVMRDWAHSARKGRFPRLGGVDVEAALAAMTTPVLAISIDNDTLVPHQVADYLTDKLAEASVVRERFTPEQAGGPLDHFRWVRSGDALAAQVAQYATGLETRRTLER